MASLIAKNYAKALFNIAVKDSSVESFKSELKDIKELYLENDDLSKVIAHPDVLKKDKISIIEKIFNYENDLMYFLKVLVDNDRFSYLPEISDVFEELSNEYLGIEIVKVTSAIKLNKEDFNSIKQLVEKKINKKVELQEIIDPSCLAGVRIILKDEVLDNTIDTKINNMKHMLSKVTI
ncbi:MAG: ATP synthase F1 subunit delta [Erysipelotrichaceae bacterium]|nr:ATP synthase F1 subunit delta [Erysipelotrichaceae bacterium]